MKSKTVRYTTLIIAVLCVSGLAAESRAAKVTGTVTYRGEPLAGATVSFHPQKGKPVASKTDADGSFRFQSAPVGKMVVTVKSKALPKKYASPKTSGLKFLVKDGENRINIDLK